MPAPEPDFEALLKAMTDAGVEFIVVGGVCAVLHGAPVSTFDLDLVYSRAGSNLLRLEQVLRQLDARYREKLTLRPDATCLDGTGRHLLMTKFGPLDLLGEAGAGQGFAELIDHTEQVKVAQSQVRILDLPSLIRLKESLGRDRDLAVVPILRKTLESRRDA